MLSARRGALPAEGATSNWLRQFAQHHPIVTFADVLAAASPRPPEDGDDPKARERKKNYAQRVSEASALLIANALRPYFGGILPNEDGSGQASGARTGKGVKKLDVNYSTPELGLGLGVSVKTLNFRDPKTQRYTKNTTRNDNELRAEAMDYHERQPYSVLVGVLFTPLDSCHDGNPDKLKQSRSSFAHFVNVLRHRAGRTGPNDSAQRLEALYIGLYGHAGEQRSEVRFFNVLDTPPQFGVPSTGLLDFGRFIEAIVATYDARNVVKPAWDTADSAPPTLTELETSELLPVDESSEDGAE